MGLHDNYAETLLSSQEWNEYLQGNIDLGQELYETVKKNHKVKFNLSDEHIEMIKDALPSSYHPNAERIKAQAELSEKIHDVIFDTHYDIMFNKYFRNRSFAASIPGIKMNRPMSAFYRYIAEHGSESTKSKIDELIDKVYESHLRLENAKNAELTEEDKQAYIEFAKDELRDATIELDKYGKKIAVSEIRRVADDIPRILKLIDDCNTPEKILENYREIREFFFFCFESQGFLPYYKDLFDSDEYNKLKELYGSIHIPGGEFLHLASFCSNPQLAKNIDIEEIKMLSSKELDSVLEKARSWVEIEEREASLLNDISLQSSLTYAAWCSRICDKFGIADSTIDIIDVASGERTKLTVETVQKLYEKGAPFYAIPRKAPKNLNNVSAVLCMPTKGYHIAVGEEAIEAAAKEPVRALKPQEPSGFAYAIDSFISSFSSKWRVSSVKKYEDELALYNKEKELSENAKKFSETIDDNIRREARKYGMQTLGLTEEDISKMEEQDFLRDSFNFGENELTEKDLANQERRDFIKNSFNYDKDEFTGTQVNDRISKMIEDLRVATNRARDLASVSTTKGHTTNFADYFVKKLVLDDISKMKTSNEKSDMKVISRMIRSIESVSKQKLLNDVINEVVKENGDIIQNPEELYPLVEKAYANSCNAEAEETAAEETVAEETVAEETVAEETKDVNNQKSKVVDQTANNVEPKI